MSGDQTKLALNPQALVENLLFRNLNQDATLAAVAAQMPNPGCPVRRDYSFANSNAARNKWLKHLHQNREPTLSIK